MSRTTPKSINEASNHIYAKDRRRSWVLESTLADIFHFFRFKWNTEGIFFDIQRRFRIQTHFRSRNTCFENFDVFV